MEMCPFLQKTIVRHTSKMICYPKNQSLSVIVIFLIMELNISEK